MKMLRGPLIAILGAFPAAGLMALVYRFPIPFDDAHLRGSGLAGIVPSMMAVIFYGLLGGFLVLAALGVVAAAVARVLGRGDPTKTARLTVGLALAASLICAVFIATLHLFIGRW